MPARSLNIEGIEGTLLLSRGELFGNAYGKLSNAMLFHNRITIMTWAHIYHAIYSMQTRCILGTTIYFTVLQSIYFYTFASVGKCIICTLNIFIIEHSYCIDNFILPRII